MSDVQHRSMTKLARSAASTWTLIVHLGLAWTAGGEAADASAVRVARGKTFRLGFGVFVHSAPEGKPVDLQAAYTDYLDAIAHRRAAGSRENAGVEQPVTDSDGHSGS